MQDARNPKTKVEAANSLCSEPDPKRRRRTIASCLACRSRKIRCDRIYPCSGCVKRGEQGSCAPAEEALNPQNTQLRQHNYSAAATGPTSPTSPQEVESLRAKVVALEKMLGGATGPTPPSTTTLPRSEAETEAAATVLEELALQHTSGPSSAKLELPPCPFPSPLGSLYPTIVATYPRPMSNLDNIILNGLLDMLPSNDVLERLIPRYMDHPAFGMHILCFPQFKQEVAEFIQLRVRHQAYMVDPAWLSVLFSVLGDMADILIDMGSSVEGFVVGQETNSDLLQAAWHAMSLAHPLLNTNFRCLQAFVYYTYRTHKGASALKCFGSKNKVHANMRSYSALAIRLAEKLDLHKLSANEQAMPKLPDPAFPSQPSFFARQMGLRLWATVYLVESFLRTSDNILSLSSLPLEEPANITDEELGFATIPSKDDTEITAVLPDRVKLRIAANFVKGEVLRSEGRDEYEIVQLLDQDLEDRMGSLAKIHDTKALHPLWCCFGQYRARILKIHRPWMLRGIADPRYKKSYDRSLESAFAVISILAENLPLPPSSKLSYFMGNILSAAIALTSVLLAQNHTNCFSTTTIACRSTVQLCQASLDVVASRNLSKSVRDIASHVSRIVSVLKETDASTRNQRLEGSTIEQAVAAKLQSAAAKLQDKPEATGSTQLDKPHVQPVPTQVSNATGGQLPVGLSQGDASPGRTEEFDLLPGFSTDLDLNASALDFSWLLGESGDTSLSYQ